MERFAHWWRPQRGGWEAAAPPGWGTAARLLRCRRDWCRPASQAVHQGDGLEVHEEFPLSSLAASRTTTPLREQAPSYLTGGTSSRREVGQMNSLAVVFNVVFSHWRCGSPEQQKRQWE